MFSKTVAVLGEFGQNHKFCRCLLTVREIVSRGVSLSSLTLSG